MSTPYKALKQTICSDSKKHVNLLTIRQTFFLTKSFNSHSMSHSMWKYVDDVSLSEGLVRNSNSTIQASLDTIASWSSSNRMKLNAKKCKEMRICFLKDPIELPHLKIDDQQLELVTSHKVLGLVIQNNLKWNNHIESIVTKASKRLHILRVLRRGGVEINDLISIYSALIRSLLEYCCVVWHHALPSYLSQELERI